MSGFVFVLIILYLLAFAVMKWWGIVMVSLFLLLAFGLALAIDPYGEVAERIGIEREVLCVLTMIESGGDPEAVNSDAVGLLQVRPVALKDVNRLLGTRYTIEDLKDPYVNLLVGGSYWKYLYNYFLVDYTPWLAEIYAVMAYNWGVGNVIRWLAEGGDVPDETKEYVIKWVRYRGKGAEVCRNFSGRW